MTGVQTCALPIFDPLQLRQIYYPEVIALVQQISGARRVVVFDHTLRSGNEQEREQKLLREPVFTVHNDYTEWSGPQRVRDLLPAAEAEALLEHRMAVVQVWRPIRDPVLSSPLAICDARSVRPGDLIAAERHHENRVGEIYQLAYGAGQRWYWVPHMGRDEGLLIKGWDSLDDGRAQFTPHGAFELPGTDEAAPPRESIELRTLVIVE